MGTQPTYGPAKQQPRRDPPLQGVQTESQSLCPMEVALPTGPGTVGSRSPEGEPSPLAAWWGTFPGGASSREPEAGVYIQLGSRLRDPEERLLAQRPHRHHKTVNRDGVGPITGRLAVHLSRTTGRPSRTRTAQN